MELLVVMAILAILMIMAIGVINPKLQIDKGRDAQRKKDLARIKVAFEEYFSDRGCYPSDNSSRDPGMLNNLANQNNCNTPVFGPWLQLWPCDPSTKRPYFIQVEQSGGSDAPCPHYFKIYTKLQWIQDKDIPPDFYGGSYVLDGISINDANYGVSSTNVSWFSGGP